MMRLAYEIPRAMTGSFDENLAKQSAVYVELLTAMTVSFPHRELNFTQTWFDHISGAGRESESLTQHYVRCHKKLSA
jgi:hypothetical protein